MEKEQSLLGKSTKDKVLAALEADKGRYVSGTGLAQSTSVSRTAIWKAIRSLRRSGYIIDACPKRGYMLQPEKDVISEFSIKKFMHFYALFYVYLHILCRLRQAAAL